MDSEFKSVEFCTHPPSFMGGPKAPDHFACQIGWDGLDCSICVPNPGCQHGSCNEPFECNCDSGWIGSQCERGKLSLNSFQFMWI